MVNPRVALGIVAVLLLGACGYRGPITRLQPPDPSRTRDQQKEAQAEEVRQVEAGLTVPAEARPVRVDELTVKLDVRADDPFSLPPEGTAGARPIPFPGELPPAPSRFRERPADPVQVDAAAAAAPGADDVRRQGPGPNDTAPR